MRFVVFGIFMAALPLALSLPAVAETAAPQPLPAAVSAEPDIGLPRPPRLDCRQVYAPAPMPIGPASAHPEQATEGLLLLGMACSHAD
ncbi:hypothetical protein JMJ56_06505 [Belnapia sp. T18]|uniref:Uncharacterized protein n=1 Tax=Belnapia arida TaxID=2804533 RepID=A0ABS1U2W5_9PROT|nr:hypothetical protein [Belnapia arida]MBL6077651.1 hypothetical protein [Belnapia arida]